MSRSRKKNPVRKDTSGSSYRKFAKREANRRVRRTLDVADGKSYRRIYDPWNINDWVYRWSSEPYYYFDRNGDMKKSNPEPEWRARMK
jgi:hypothetical protein